MIHYCVARQTLPQFEASSEVNVLIINICISDLENGDGDLNINETQRKLRHLKSQNAKHQQLILFFFMLRS